VLNDWVDVENTTTAAKYLNNFSLRLKNMFEFYSDMIKYLNLYKP